MTSVPRQRSDLGDFLRSRRARLQPEAAGLPPRSRRRTPGLRREEVAELAQIGVTWYSWLEQGRTVRASRPALERIAVALQLSPDERAHLLALAEHPVPTKSARSEPLLSPGLQSVFDSLTTPAFIRGPRWDILAWNEAASAVFGNPLTRSEQERNSAWMVFVDPYLRRLWVDWEMQAREFLALFRADYDRQVAEREWYDELVERISERSPEFRRWWPEHDVHHWQLQSGALVHPAVGQFFLDRTELSADNSPGTHLVVFIPKPGTDSTEKLELLLKLHRGEPLGSDKVAGG